MTTQAGMVFTDESMQVTLDGVKAEGIAFVHVDDDLIVLGPRWDTAPQYRYAVARRIGEDMWSGFFGGEDEEPVQLAFADAEKSTTPNTIFTL